MATTAFEMVRDGVPVDVPFGRGGGSELTRRVVAVDRVLEHADGKPTRVRRSFETVEAEGAVLFGENEMALEQESPLDGVVLELSLEDGEVVAEVVEGEEPDAEASLEGHALTLALDALLPAADVALEESWELEAEAVLRGLGLDVESALFPPPSREEGERGGRGGPGGRRGGPRGGGGGSATRLFAQGEWEAEATFAAEDEEYEGGVYALVELELESTGELPEPQFGGRGGGRGDDMLRPAGAAERVLDSTFEIELKGRLLFSQEDRLPVLLEVEGTITTQRDIEREGRDGGTMEISTTQEGTFQHVVRIAENEDQ